MLWHSVQSSHCLTGENLLLCQDHVIFKSLMMFSVWMHHRAAWKSRETITLMSSQKSSKALLYGNTKQRRECTTRAIFAWKNICARCRAYFNALDYSQIATSKKRNIPMIIEQEKYPSKLKPGRCYGVFGWALTPSWHSPHAPARNFGVRRKVGNPQVKLREK